ncbi:methionine aminopeptidase 1D, mitochondrial-like isoform X2 [Eriocheir sinensis]|uniref:methionine aminopeptidase 1D, mitochondrial-like isoform X2 n=1 Tax=Eriocheir sinensis TaxID=95602 RepID=UPI0021C59BFD|nr:methionine aminopeptidase 1D, mitochondrial-like isoform X2 [Eriocheir sinensis]
MAGGVVRGAYFPFLSAPGRKILTCGCGGAADTLLTPSRASSWSVDSRGGGGRREGGAARPSSRSYFSSSFFRPSPLSTLTPRHCGVWDIFRRVNFGSYSLLDNVGEVSAAQLVPEHIPRPPYAETGQPPPPPASAELHSKEGIEAMRAACSLAVKAQNTVRKNIKAGMTTAEIDELVHRVAVEGGAYPSPLNYLGFPKSVCTSVNNVACHGIPDDRPLVDGDIISVDVTVYLGGVHGDCCETYLIGDVDEPGQHLVRAAKRCRDEAISLCAPGIPFAVIGNRVEQVANKEGVTVVPCFIGHGIGSYFHGPPDIYHCYNFFPGEMQPGMTFTIEPVIAQGKEEVLILEDGWTAVMTDNGRAAQFEHTILITETGYEILTESIRGYN